MGLHLVFFWISNLVWLTKALALASSSLAKSSECEDKCGNVAIPYPFGIGANCSHDHWFVIDCNKTTSPPTLFLSSISLEVLDISLVYGNTIRVKNPVFYWNCSDRNNSVGVNLEGSPFMFSYDYNRFTAVGCNNQAIMTHDDSTIWGCKSTCGPTTLSQDNICNGINCCQTPIPWNLTVFNVTWNIMDADKGGARCAYAFLVEQNKSTNPFVVNSTEYVPALVEWGLYSDSNLLTPRQDSSFYCSNLYNIDHTRLPATAKPATKEILIFLMGVKILMNASPMT